MFRYAGLQAASQVTSPGRTLSQILASIKAGGLADRSGRGAATRVDSAARGTQVHSIYLPASDKVLVSRNHQLKLVSRGPGGNGGFFEDPAAAHFGSHIHGILDEVSIFISPSELKRLLDLLDWSQAETDPIVSSFLERLDSTYDGRCVRAPCFEALLAIKGLTCVAVQQAKRIEDQARAIEASDLTLKERPDAATGKTDTASLSFIDAN